MCEYIFTQTYNLIFTALLHCSVLNVSIQLQFFMLLFGIFRLSNIIPSFQFLQSKCHIAMVLPISEYLTNIYLSLLFLHHSVPSIE